MRTVKLANNNWQIRLADDQVITNNQFDIPELADIPKYYNQEILPSHEFDGPLIEWFDKGHQLKRTGMQRADGVFSWKLVLQQKQGTQWAVFIDNRSNMEHKRVHISASGREDYAIRFSDYRTVENIKLPFSIEYVDKKGNVYLQDKIDFITLQTNN